MTSKTLSRTVCVNQRVTFHIDLEDVPGELCIECGNLDGLSDEKLCRLAIAKWETIVWAYEKGAIRVHDGGGDTCAFCIRYMGMNICTNCPIHRYAGAILCRCTPYHDYRQGVSNKLRPHALKRRAGAEVAFLYRVLDLVRKENERD